MKVKLLFLIMTLLLAAPAFAQNSGAHKSRDERKKEMMEFKLKFLADEIVLKEDQKKKFDETYAQMEKERRAIFKKMENADKLIKDKANATDSDYEHAVSEKAKAREDMMQIEKKYEEKFATFLTSKQMYKLKEAEDKFKETMRKTRDCKKHEKR